MFYCARFDSPLRKVLLDRCQTICIEITYVRLLNVFDGSGRYLLCSGYVFTYTSRPNVAMLLLQSGHGP